MIGKDRLRSAVSSLFALVTSLVAVFWILRLTVGLVSVGLVSACLPRLAVSLFYETSVADWQWSLPPSLSYCRWDQWHMGCRRGSVQRSASRRR
jgi:hypothetical protein